MHDSDEGEQQTEIISGQQGDGGEETEIIGDTGVGEEGDCEERVGVQEERCEGHGVVKGEIETEVDLADCANVGGNVHGNDDCMENLVGCEIEEEEVDGEYDGAIEVDVVDCGSDTEEEEGDGEYDGASWSEMSDSDFDDGINIDDDRGLSDDEWESEELYSGAESDGKEDEEESYGKFVTFSMPKSMVDYKWDLGTYFAEKQDLLDAIKTYAVENGRNIRYVKNDKKRIKAKCMGAKGKCPWMTYCAYMEAIHTWQLRTIVDNHSCSREHRVRLLNAK
ncbi:hypothetical protein V8G54_027092 [Vigna mungo]|uniref:Transposase MuDR plant domain-containing protein n=1 Tax=Vigna mungo TaxID=3915 RepID=A0AAQ3RQ35_VIGMU